MRDSSAVDGRSFALVVDALDVVVSGATDDFTLLVVVALSVRAPVPGFSVLTPRGVN